MDAEVFSYQQNRCHQSFNSMKVNIVSSTMFNEKFRNWIEQKLFDIKIKLAYLIVFLIILIIVIRAQLIKFLIEQNWNTALII